MSELRDDYNPKDVSNWTDMSLDEMFSGSISATMQKIVSIQQIIEILRLDESVKTKTLKYWKDDVPISDILDDLYKYSEDVVQILKTNAVFIREKRKDDE